MKISDLAKEAGTSVSTIRFYEAQGLMPKPPTSEGGYRIYGPGELERLRLILAAKRQRFPLGQIRAVLTAFDTEPEPCADVARVVHEKIASIGRDISDLQRLQTHLTGQLEAWKQGTLPKAQCLCAILETDALLELKGSNNGKD